MKKKIIVIHSGGMDSSICLALALKEFDAEDILSLSFNYHQRHSPELVQAQKIAAEWCVDHIILDIPCLQVITQSALIDSSIPIQHGHGKTPPNTIVIGRNGLMARLGAIHAQHLGTNTISMGVMGVDGSHSGYRDCSRDYMNKMEDILRLDLDDETFNIRTPLVHMSKKETMALADSLGVLDFLWENTITCYEGLRREGCKQCPSCLLRNEGLRLYRKK